MTLRSASIPTNAAIRRTFAQLFKLEADFNALLIDYFPDVYHKIPQCADRTSKENLLLTLKSAQSIWAAIYRYLQDVVSTDAHMKFPCSDLMGCGDDNFLNSFPRNRANQSPINRIISTSIGSHRIDILSQFATVRWNGGVTIGDMQDGLRLAEKHITNKEHYYFISDLTHSKIPALRALLYSCDWANAHPETTTVCFGVNSSHLLVISGMLKLHNRSENSSAAPIVICPDEKSAQLAVLRMKSSMRA